MARTIKAFILSLLFLPPVLASSPIPDFQAHYDVHVGFFKVGEATRALKWNPSENRHEYRSAMRATGFTRMFLKKSVTRVTVFEALKKGVRPLNYQYEDTNNLSVNQAFNWENKVVSSQYKGRTYTFDTPEGTQDQNLYQVALMLDVAAGKRNWTYQLAENKKLKPYPISYLHNEPMDTPFGETDTVVITSKRNKQQTTLWCAPSLNYLPVQIKHSESGITYTATLTSLSGIQPE